MSKELVAQLRLQVQEQQAELQALRDELAGEARLATLGELARPVTHEFNNFLNLLLLQMTVLEMDLPEQQRADLQEIRRHATAVASLIRQYQRYRQQPGGRHSADLNAVLAEALEVLRTSPACPGEVRPVFLAPGQSPGQGGITVEWLPAPDLPCVAAAVPELRRLCLLLLKNAVAVVDPAAGILTIRTAATGDRVAARIEDNGPPIPEERLPMPFDPNTPGRDGASGLELAACRNIARRLEGNLSAENRPEGGAAVVLDLPAAS